MGDRALATGLVVVHSESVDMVVRAGVAGFYCCAVPFTTSAKEMLSPVESSILAEKVQWSWSSLETAGVEPLFSG